MIVHEVYFKLFTTGGQLEADTVEYKLAKFFEELNLTGVSHAIWGTEQSELTNRKLIELKDEYMLDDRDVENIVNEVEKNGN